MQRSLIRTGLALAAQHPALILWYLQNRLRQAILPLERLAGDGRSLPPRYVTLKPTLRCNLRCAFCRFVANGDVFGGRDWLDREDWLRVVDEIAPYRPYICLTGGEPTLYPHLPELIARIKSHGLICVLTTNGTLLEAKAAALAMSPPDVVILSIDGPREVHDRARVMPGTYDRALRGARALAERMLDARGRMPGEGSRPLAGDRSLTDADRMQITQEGTALPSARPSSSRHTLRLVLNAAITGHTWESAQEMIRVAREFGAWALHFQHFWFMTQPMVDAHNARWGDCFPLDADHVGLTGEDGVDPDALFDTIERLRREDFGFPVLFYPELTRDQMRTYYRAPERFTHTGVPSCAWTSTDILPNGDVAPCFDLVVGNVLHEPFAKIWESEPFRAHRRRLSEHGPYPICARCCDYFRHD